MAVEYLSGSKDELDLSQGSHFLVRALEIVTIIAPYKLMQIITRLILFISLKSLCFMISAGYWHTIFAFRLEDDLLSMFGLRGLILRILEKESASAGVHSFESNLLSSVLPVLQDCFLEQCTAHLLVPLALRTLTKQVYFVSATQ